MNLDRFGSVSPRPRAPQTGGAGLRKLAAAVAAMVFAACETAMPESNGDNRPDAPIDAVSARYLVGGPYAESSPDGTEETYADNKPESGHQYCGICLECKDSDPFQDCLICFDCGEDPNDGTKGGFDCDACGACEVEGEKGPPDGTPYYMGCSDCKNCGDSAE